MVNHKLIKLVKRISVIFMAVFLFTMGYLIGDGIRAKSIKNNVTQEAQISQKTVISEPTDNTVSQEEIKQFLIAFYTRKELEENRERYRVFMTEGLYQATIAEENKAVNQAYKGYIVDQVYEDSDIYIDTAKNEAIVTVKHNSTLLAQKNNYERKTLQTNKDSLKLTYVKNNGKWLVNTMTPLTLETSHKQASSFGQSSHVIRDDVPVSSTGGSE